MEIYAFFKGMPVRCRSHAELPHKSNGYKTPTAKEGNIL